MSVGFLPEASRHHELNDVRFAAALEEAYPAPVIIGAQSITLIALLDDGSLEAIGAIGLQAHSSRRQQLFADPAWVALGNGSEAVQCEDRTLTPIVHHGVLYGAVEWRGGTAAVPGEPIPPATHTALTQLVKERVQA